MKNASATFQRLLNHITADIPGCRAYIDDIVVHSDSWTEHMAQLKLLFQKLDEANLTVNLAKSEFGKATVTYLGHEVGNGKVRTRQEKVRAIQEMPIPTNRRGVRTFLGMVGYHRKFCCNFAQIALPLT